jgi:hypothetical protein
VARLITEQQRDRRPARHARSRSRARARRPLRRVEAEAADLSRSQFVAGAARPFHKARRRPRGCPRWWRSRRTAISSSYPIEQTPTSRCVCSLMPTDGRARDHGGPPFACQSGCPRRRERRAAEARPLRKPGSARAPCLRSWQSSSGGVSRSTTSQRAPPAAGDAFGRHSDRGDVRGRRPKSTRQLAGPPCRGRLSRVRSVRLLVA